MNEADAVRDEMAELREQLSELSRQWNDPLELLKRAYWLLKREREAGA
jgi:hypothetical protein